MLVIKNIDKLVGEERGRYDEVAFDVVSELNLNLWLRIIISPLNKWKHTENT